MSTIHACGFYTDDRPRVDGMSVAVCPDGETPYQAFTRIRSNIHHFGGEIESIRTMRPLDVGGPVRIEWGSPAHDATARMWHVVTSASADDWKAKP